MQGPKEAFADFIQKLFSAVIIMIPDSEDGQIIIKSLAFKNANSLCKRITWSLKAMSAPLEEWIWDTINLDSHEHDDTWIEKVIFRNLRKKSKCQML